MSDAGFAFAAVDEVLATELGTDGAHATWTTPRGGYFSSLFTTAPVAARVVELANAAGVSLTPAGATYPGGVDPENRNIRIAPTRPPLDEVRTAMKVAVRASRWPPPSTGRPEPDPVRWTPSRRGRSPR